MDGWVDAWLVDGWIGEWMDDEMDSWTDVWREMSGWIGAWMIGCLLIVGRHGWMGWGDGWMGELMDDGWMGGWTVRCKGDNCYGSCSEQGGAGEAGSICLHGRILP